MEFSQDLLTKHAVAIEAARKYWVLCEPTGMSDRGFDELESAARLDGLELRDYVCQEIQGTRTQNAPYIGKVPKTHVQGSMIEAVREFEAVHGPVWWVPKYDGSSLAAYYDPETGRVVRVVTVGGSNLGDLGIDQTEKLAGFFPSLPGTGVQAIQGEFLVPLESGYGESSRQKANGLINASYNPIPRAEWLTGSTVSTRTDAGYEKYLAEHAIGKEAVRAEIERIPVIRGFRYFIAPGWDAPADYREVMRSGFGEPVRSGLGLPRFAGALVMDRAGLEAMGDKVESDVWETGTGTFLVDGLVAYSKDGQVIGALKYRGAGTGEATTVVGIRWNDQSAKGKDSWSANALIEPVRLRGSVITKPSVGSVRRMMDTGLSRGAKVTLVLAGSTIPTVDRVLKPGNLDFEWPTCQCGYTLGPADVYGSLLKCGNQGCTSRRARMEKYLAQVPDLARLDLDRLLVIDRTKIWGLLNRGETLSRIKDGLRTGTLNLREILSGIATTPLRTRNLELVSGLAEEVLTEWWNGLHD